MRRSSAQTTQTDTLGAALIAAALAMVAALAARLLLNISSPAELFGDRLTALIPVTIFARLLDTFGANAKHLYFDTLVVFEGLCTAAGGVLYMRLRRSVAARLQRRTDEGEAQPPAPPDILEAPLVVALLWALSAGVLAPLIDGGFFGAALPGGILGTLGTQIVPDGVFALVFLSSVRRALEREAAQGATASAGSGVSRRRLLRQGVIAALVLGGGAFVIRSLSDSLSGALGLGGGGSQPRLQLGAVPERIVPPPQPVYGTWPPVSGQTPEVTSAANFYYVSKDLVGDPHVAQQSWRLAITGMVDHPYALSYADLLALPKVERYHTLNCISNDIGGNLMSTADFTGVRLADLLNHAGIRAGADTLIFRAADGYSDSLHLAQALDPRALVVYLLNGEALPTPHGFPARLLIPDLYGMKNGKWLTQLEVASGTYTGYWEERGWTREAHVKTFARIDVPVDGDLLLARATSIAGIAYAGERGIARVEVTVDGGRTWQPALLRQPLDALTWVLWEFPWQPTTGTYIIAVRAIDLAGNVQQPTEAPPIPDGVSGYHAITVTVR